MSSRMGRRSALVLGLVAAGAAASSAAPLPARMRGICWEAGGRIERERLAPLRALGADWISQTPFGWCSSAASPEIRMATDGRIYWGERDEGLAATTRMARALGIRTLLKPHLWIRGGSWVGEIQMKSDDDWRRWFQAYEAFILHYAELAERERMDGLAIGTELTRASGRAEDWRRLIARIRAVYHGPLTYCANWHEAESVPFWDAIDFVGVQAYYPLTTSERPTPAQMRAGWGPVVSRLEALSRRTGKRIVFTEVGYKSVAGALVDPWRWDADGMPAPALQRDAFQAMFESMWDRSWFGGTFVWKWHAFLRPGQALPPHLAGDFTPQGKPALEVIRAFYTRP